MSQHPLFYGKENQKIFKALEKNKKMREAAHVLSEINADFVNAEIKIHFWTK